MFWIVYIPSGETTPVIYPESFGSPQAAANTVEFLAAEGHDPLVLTGRV